MWRGYAASELLYGGNVNSPHKQGVITSCLTIRQPERAPCRHRTVRQFAGYTRHELDRRGDR
jgi:hypothetical protein